MNNTQEHPLLKIIHMAQQQENSKNLTLEAIKPYLNSKITPRIVAKNDYISISNNPIKKVYYIISGSFSIIRTSEDGKITIRTQNAPSFLGVDCTVLSIRSCYPEIQTLETCTVLEINQVYFLQSIRENGELCFLVLHEICQKFYHSSYRYNQTLFYEPHKKLMIYILNQWIINLEPKKKFTIAMANTRIAEEIGISIRTFYRAVNKLKSDHIVTIVSGNISVTYEQIIRMQSLLQNSSDVLALSKIFDNN